MGWGEGRRPRITGDDFDKALAEAVRTGKVRLVGRDDYERRWDGKRIAALHLEIVEDDDA